MEGRGGAGGRNRLFMMLPFDRFLMLTWYCMCSRRYRNAMSSWTIPTEYCRCSLLVGNLSMALGR